MSFTGLISEQPSENYKRFSKVKNFLVGDTLVFANLESPVNESDEFNEYKALFYYSEKKVTIELLKRLNIKALSLANNHIYDLKMPGLKATIKLLEDLGINYTGAGWKKEHVKPAIVSIKGFKVGFIAYVDKSTNPRTEFFPELFINYLEPEKVMDDIKSIRDKVDKIICSVHWGMDYSRFFTKMQQMLARKLIDAGADIIMGHHPHTFQPYEVYKDGVIFYSLGQLCNGDMFWEGEMRALKRKTKISYIPVLNEDFTIERFIKTKELKGNYIKIYQRNRYEAYNRRLYKLNILKNNNKLVDVFINIKENVIDRFIEYFFGYYRNPFKQVLSIFRNIHKIKYIKRDLNKTYKS